MAATAEAFNLTEFAQDLYEAAPVEPVLLDADSTPELRFARLRAGQLADSILEANRQLLRDGDYDAVPIPVDVLGTARRVGAAKRQFGEDSSEYADLYEGLLLDSRRLMGEAARANTWEYFPPATQTFDRESGQYFSHGMSLTDILAQGLSPVAEPEEQSRRRNEYIEERTYQALGSMALEQAVELFTVSECPDWAIKAHESDQKSSHGGYVPAIKKLMVRGVRIDENGDRTEEQIGLSGERISHDVIVAVLEEQGVIEAGQMPSKLELHGKQFIGRAIGGVIGMAKLLDRKASEISGRTVFMGEVVAEATTPEYDTVAVLAEQRRLALAGRERELADYLVALEENGTDRWAAEGLVAKHLKRVFWEIAQKNPETAADIFDRATADGIIEVLCLEAAGRNDEAESLLEKVKAAAPDITYCGAGSCDLEAVNEGSSDAATARGAGLKGELLRHTKGTCLNCRRTGGVLYDMAGNRVCTSCRSSQVNGVKDMKRLSGNKHRSDSAPKAA